MSILLTSRSICEYVKFHRFKQCPTLVAGVLSCDFADSFENSESEDEKSTLLLATGGRDALVKLWWVRLSVDETGAQTGALELASSLAAHGGAVQCVRWGRAGSEGGLALATGGADRWARVWRVWAGGGRVRVQVAVAVPAGAGGAPAVRLLGGEGGRLAVGSLGGALTVWRVPLDDALQDAEGEEPRFWSAAGVERWLREYVTRPPGNASRQL